jgi:hypothetical protein
MKKIFLILSLITFLTSCNHSTVEKPANLIEEEVMTNILYDLSIMEAIKSQNPYAPQNQFMNPKDYIFKKYKTDSLQFATSNRYYVSQIETYKKMHDRVSERLEREKIAADSLVLIKGNGTQSNGSTSDTPQIQ